MTTLTQHVCLMAQYNAWMNIKLFDTAAKLSEQALTEDKGAFFGSILGTLNHIAIADTIWLKRFAPHLPEHNALNLIRELAQPDSLGGIPFATLDALRARRLVLDQILTALAESLSDADLAITVRYTNSKGIISSKNLFGLLMHVFNHQTHHRGQVTTLLTQCGLDVGVTDLAAIILDV